jgi:hypothetical protein
MSLNFAPEDVRRHLEGLGYTTINDRQLKDFIRDLRRLIRYEEKQKRLEQFIKVQPQPKDDESSEDGDDHRGHSAEVSPRSTTTSVKAKRQVHQEVKKTLKQERKTLHYNRHTGDISVTNDSVSLSYEASSSSRDEVDVRIQVTQAPRHKFLPIEESPRQILPPRPDLPTKPTCSFIRPVIKAPEAKSFRHDPVRLHQFYQEQWSKTRLPGELNRTEKDLRWATREWMMGPPRK